MSIFDFIFKKKKDVADMSAPFENSAIDTSNWNTTPAIMIDNKPKNIQGETYVPSKDLGSVATDVADKIDATVLGALNTPTGKKITAATQEITSNLPLRYTASMVDSVHGVFTGQWDNDTEKAWLEARNDPDNSKMAQFLYGVQDSGFQTAVGVAVSLIPAAGPALGGSYWTALSAEEQRGKDRNADGVADGEAYSTTNLTIDVALDSMLGKSIGSMLKSAPALGFKGVLAALNKNGITEGGTEVAQSLLKYSNDYLRAKTPEEKAIIANEFKNYLTEEMALEFATAYTSGALIAGGGMAVGKTNLNAVSQTVNIAESDRATIAAGLEEAKAKAGITPDIVKEGMVEAQKQVDHTQNPVVQTALQLTENGTGIVAATDGITTAQNVNGHILYNPLSPTITEDIVGAAFEPVMANFTNTFEAIEASYQYEKGDLTKEMVQSLKEEMARRGLSNTSNKSVQKFLKEQIFKSVAYNAIADKGFAEKNPDLYNAFQADLEGGSQTRSNAQAIKETQRRYSSKNYTVTQARDRFAQDLETYKTTGKFPSKTLKNIYERAILSEKVKKGPEYKRVMGKKEAKERDNVRASEMADKSLSNKLDTLKKQNISKEDLANLELTQAERDILNENFGENKTIKLESLKNNITNVMAAETSDLMIKQLDEAFNTEDIPVDITEDTIDSSKTIVMDKMKNIEAERFHLDRIDKSPEDNDLVGENYNVYYRGTMDEAEVYEALQPFNLEDKSEINFHPIRISETLEDPIETADAFSFVSPNIEENLSPEMVLENMKTPRHIYIKKMSQDVDRKMNMKTATIDASGFWGDGQENTLFTLYRGIDTYEDLRYNVALKGLASDQKAVIPFLADENGPDTLHVISFGNETPTEVEKKLTHFGLEYKTIFELNGQTMAAIFDKESGLDDNINNLKQYADSIISKKGRGEFLGNLNTWDENTRAGARRIYREVISAYEEGQAMQSNRYEGSLPGRPVLRRDGVLNTSIIDDVAKNKYELSEDKIVYETENYTVYDIDGKQLIKTNTNLGFEVLEAFDTIEKGLDFIVIEPANLGDIRDTADYMMANKVINEDLIASNMTIKMVTKGTTDINVNKLLTIREKTLLKMRIRALARGAKMGWVDARRILNLAFRVKLDALKDIRAALVQEIKTLNPEDQAKMIVKLNNITSKDQSAKVERAYIAIRDLKNEAERQDLIYSVKKIAKIVKRKLSTGTGVNYQYIKMMADILEEYNVKSPTKDTIKKLTELKTYLESLGSKEVQQLDGSMQTVYNHPAGMYIPKLAILGKKNIADLSKEELQDLNETLVELWAVGKAVYKDEKLKSQERARVNYEMLKASVVNLDSTNGSDKAKENKDAITSGQLDFLHTFRAFNKIDGYQNYNGMAVAWQRRIHGDTTRAEDRHNQMIKETFKEIEAIVGKNGRITDEEIEASAFFLYADQESYDEDGQLIASPQAQSVIDNNGWDGPPQRTERVDAFVSLLRDKMDSIYDELSGTYIMVENKAFPRLKNYFPYYYDRAGNLTFEPNANQLRALRKGAKKDFSYARSKNVNKKIRTDILSIFSNSMYERYYYIEVQPTLKEMREMLNHKDIKEDENGKKTVTTFQDFAGHVTSKYFADFIDIIANRGKKSGFANSRLLDGLRQNVSYAVMGYNLTSALMQPLAIADATVWTGVMRGTKAGSKMLARFALNFLNPRFASKVKSQSAVLRNRQGGEFAFVDIAPKQTGKGVIGNVAANSINFLRQHAYDMIKAPDIQTASIVQNSIYRDLMDEGGVSEADARKEAEFVMNIVSGSADIADRPLILGKSQGARFFLTFQTFVLNRFGMIGHDLIMQKIINAGNSKQMITTLHNVPRKKLASILAALIGFMMMSMVGAFEDIYRRVSRKYIYGKDDKETNFYEDALFSYVEMIPLIGSTISDVRAGRQASASLDMPTLAFLADMANGISKLKSENEDTRTKGQISIGKSIASFLGVPGTNFGVNLFSQFAMEQTTSPSPSSEVKSGSSPMTRPKREARPKRPARPPR